MGKIVKAARVAGERFIVAVPDMEFALARPERVTEFDGRFVASHRSGIDDPFESELDAPDREASLPEPQIDWNALRADAEAIVDRAASDAGEMIRQAQAAALRLVELAEAHGITIEEESRTNGYDAGFAQGKAAADADMTEMVHTLHSLMASLREQRAATIESAEPEIVRLAMSIAERVVHDQISADPNVVVENVRSALTRLVSREVVTLRVHPSDLETMRQHRDAIVAVSDVEHLRIVEDQRVDRGGVVVETDAGTIDAKIATQLREARRAIRADDGIAS